MMRRPVKLPAGVEAEGLFFRGTFRVPGPALAQARAPCGVAILVAACELERFAFLGFDPLRHDVPATSGSSVAFSADARPDRTRYAS